MYEWINCDKYECRRSSSEFRVPPREAEDLFRVATYLLRVHSPIASTSFYLGSSGCRSGSNPSKFRTPTKNALESRRFRGDFVTIANFESIELANAGIAVAKAQTAKRRARSRAELVHAHDRIVLTSVCVSVRLSACVSV